VVTVGVLVLVRPAAREKDDNGVASLRKTTDVIPQVVARTYFAASATGGGRGNYGRRFFLAASTKGHECHFCIGFLVLSFVIELQTIVR